MTGKNEPSSKETAEGKSRQTPESTTSSVTPINKKVEPPSSPESGKMPAVVTTQSSMAPVTIGAKQVSIADVKSSLEGVQAPLDQGQSSVDMVNVDEGLQIVTFLLNENYYGVDISTVETIIKPQPVCPVPFTPEYVEGLTNLRGQIVPIIDLRKRLGFADVEINKESRIIIVNIHNEWAGVRVDSVTGVTTLPSDSIEPPSHIISDSDISLLSGIARSEKDIILLLDIPAVFAVADKNVHHVMKGGINLS